MTIRTAEPRDAAAIAALLPVLGYPSTESEVSARLAALLASPDQAVFVADTGGEVSGLCQVQGVRNITSNGYAEVMALVVASLRQRTGTGTALVRRAVEWASANGYARVRLRSGIHREDAHRFYGAMGFKQAKTSVAFEIAC